MWDSSMETQVKVACVVKASQRYSDFLRDIRNSKEKPEYMSKDNWRHWKVAWETSEFKMKREKNSNNWRSVAGPSSHTRGSVSHVEHGKRLASSLGRTPTPHELFVFTHTKKHDGQTFIDEKSKALNDKMVSLREISQINSGLGNDASQSIDKIELYYKAAGGEKKKRLYGLGSQSYDYYCIGNTNGNKSTASSSEAQNQMDVPNELTLMHKKFEIQENLISDLRTTIQMLCNHVGMPPPPGSQNTSNSQPEECDDTRDGGDGSDYGLS